MINDKDVKKLITAFAEVFPTAKMMKKSFDNVPTKVEMEAGFKKIDKRLDSVIEKHEEESVIIKGRIKTLEDAMGIE